MTMKSFYTLILMVALTTFVASCKKDSNNKIVGKWKFVEQFDGYANGGTFRWYAIPTEYSHTLTLSKNGQYIRKENSSGNFEECIGTYVIINSTSLEFITNCNSGTEKTTISELTATSLIIDRQVFEGKIRYKYLAVE